MLFPDLPADARTWVFTADRALSPPEQTQLLDALAPFLTSWASHGRPVPGDAAVLHDRFLIVGARLEGGVSGCGIDSLTHAVEEVGAAVGIAWLSGLHVAYRDDAGAVQVLPRPAFRERVRAGEITAETPVFVTTTDALDALRDEGLERPAGVTWHARVFRIAEPA